jgi:hypothetical protein
MQKRTLLTALLALPLWAAGAHAQAPQAASVEPPSRIMKKAIPQLYFLKLQGLLQDAVIDPLAHRYAVKITMRIKLDASGAIIKWDWIDRAMGMPIYDNAIRKVMADFGPDGDQRLPIASDKQLADQVIQHGFLCELRFKPKAKFEKARKAHPKPDAAPAAPASKAK